MGGGACPLCLTERCTKQRRRVPASGLALSALRHAVLNKGAVFSLPGLPSQALRASSPKGGAFSRRQTFRYIQNLSLWERWHREAMTERASPLTAAQGLGLDRASDRAALPQGSAEQRRSVLASVLALSGRLTASSSPKGRALGKGGTSPRSAFGSPCGSRA